VGTLLNTSNQDVEIIAEACCNHVGNMSLAEKMIEQASLTGADTVKFQSFKTDSLVNPGDIKEFCRKAELTKYHHAMLMDVCSQSGVKFLSSAFDMESLMMLRELGCTEVKIPSGQAVNRDLLAETGKLGFLKVYLSTGMCSLEDVTRAMSTLEHAGIGREKVVLMQCTTCYPCHEKDANLNVLETYKKVFGGPVGFSDHTNSGVGIACAAVAMGAIAIEKHFILDKELNRCLNIGDEQDNRTPDDCVSFRPLLLSHYIWNIRKTQAALGSGQKRILECETAMLHRKDEKQCS
jgi:N,N'-diacetyllegionaminate synthase